MTPLPDEQPLSRRQLREQQRTTEPTAPTEPRSRRVSTTSPVAGGDIPEVNPTPAEPNLTTDEVTVLEEAQASGRPLTRRQSRDLERVRTASLSVVTPEPTDAPGSVVEDAPADGVQAVGAVPAVVERDSVPATKKNGKRDQQAGNRIPSFVPSSARVAEPDVVDAEIVQDEPDAEAESRQSAFELITSPHPESPFGPAATVQAGNGDDEASRLADDFGRSVIDTGLPVEAPTVSADEPFDQIIARGLEEAGNGVSTSSIILPIMPNAHPLTGPLSANGNVVVTGSIDLPSSMGASGNADQFDKSDIDAMFDAEDEARPATAGTPVSASKAVSTHTATRDVITPPAPARSNRLLLILAITAGVLAVAVLSVIIVGIAAGAFQSR
ncbi:hypothetical protein IWX78_001229 [Mycetocola sp. CAN_C7]|uniref:hypothetical protein n=1 Tax=Mycetocola sp. CAN_C7 TaxID=2787724 RepID=UPI0018C9478A